MDILELQKKSDDELRDMLNVTVTALQELRFKAANLQLKEVRKVREMRRDVARIQTMLSQRALAKQASQVKK